MYLAERDGLNEYSSYQRGTHRNHADKGVAYPGWQPMGMKIKICDGSSWATRGGKDIVDRSKGTFIASFVNNIMELFFI
ncbi:putative xyloglucan:xyloglucosyl transferase [Helianthus anomalus]